MGNAVINGMPLEAFMELREEIDTLRKELTEIKSILRECYEADKEMNYTMVKTEDIEKILGIIKEETTCCTIL